jgi:hypothetical protein
MKTRLDTSRILERMVRLIPERSRLAGLSNATNLVGGDVRADGFTLELSVGEGAGYRIVGTIRDSGDERLVRLRVASSPLQWWPAPILAVAASGIVYWRLGIGSPLAVAIAGLVGVGWSRLTQPTLTPTDDLCIQIKSALDAEVI